MNKAEVFLYCYSFYLENVLTNKKTELSRIKFQSEEANTDEYIKVYLKGVISEYNVLPVDYIRKSLVISQDGQNTTYNLSQISCCKIEKVYLPAELSSRQKQEILETKHSVYTNPDLYLKVNDGVGISYHSLEIKTTKNNQIPGSSVQQVTPDEWTVFIKHSTTGVEVACGMYMNALSDRLPFPDRSPRPIIGFDLLQKWNKNNRKSTSSTITYNINSADVDFKMKCLKNWESILCEEWLETISSNMKSSEKWFNNTIRLYSLQLLEIVKQDPQMLDVFINKLKRNIK